MSKVYKEAAIIPESQQLENLLLEVCDPETRALLRLAIDINVWCCEHSERPKLTIHCHSREIAAAIGIRQAEIKTILKQMIGCSVTIALYYTISEGLVYYDTESIVAPAKWYLCNRKDCGHMKIPLPD